MIHPVPSALCLIPRLAKEILSGKEQSSSSGLGRGHARLRSSGSRSRGGGRRGRGILQTISSHALRFGPPQPVEAFNGNTYAGDGFDGHVPNRTRHAAPNDPLRARRTESAQYDSRSREFYHFNSRPPSPQTAALTFALSHATSHHTAQSAHKSMPGLIYSPGAVSNGTVASMKRARVEEAPAMLDVPNPKKRKVVRGLRHTQPLPQNVEPLGGGFGAEGDTEFFDAQMRRAIAIHLKGAGFASATPEVMESMRGMVDDYMTNFLATVRKSMSSARRTETVPHDWICALKSVGITGSSALEDQLDTGGIPPPILQPQVAPPEPEEPAPPNLEGLLGPELSGKADKDSRKYIPKHFPPFPSKHTYMATPVFPERESDPRRIREKAAADGIRAEESLRKLMAAQKAGLQNRKGGKRKQSARLKKTNEMWRAAMEACIKGDEAREAKEKKQRNDLLDRHMGDGEDVQLRDSHSPAETAMPQPKIQNKREINLDEPVQVNYDRKFWRKNARGV
ncbi:hypothetical protein CC80DRAFT_540606 [Byssothecium circinans]|uniref:Transcription initiation factor TFIID subunit 8 n=1 Tax=Byssothecium circinans TaxID=147558 RepID=A0A6A5TBB1_9PLEO|nr:hypothetical protein CC80DRAFT_540606 [Byssothecium circinans]